MDNDNDRRDLKKEGSNDALFESLDLSLFAAIDVEEAQRIVGGGRTQCYSAGGDACIDWG